MRSAKPRRSSPAQASIAGVDHALGHLAQPRVDVAAQDLDRRDRCAPRAAGRRGAGSRCRRGCPAAARRSVAPDAADDGVARIGARRDRHQRQPGGAAAAGTSLRLCTARSMSPASSVSSISLTQTPLPPSSITGPVCLRSPSVTMICCSTTRGRGARRRSSAAMWSACQRASALPRVPMTIVLRAAHRCINPTLSSGWPRSAGRRLRRRSAAAPHRRDLRRPRRPPDRTAAAPPSPAATPSPDVVLASAPSAARAAASWRRDSARSSDRPPLALGQARHRRDQLLRLGLRQRQHVRAQRRHRRARAGGRARPRGNGPSSCSTMLSASLGLARAGRRGARRRPSADRRCRPGRSRRSSPHDGSTSRGTAMSIRNSGRPRRALLRLRDQRARQHRPRAPVDAMHDVGGGQRAGQIAPSRVHVAADARRPAPRARPRRPVGDGQRRALRAQRARRQLGHLAGADDQHPPPVEAAEHLARELDRHRADRHRVARDRGLAPHAPRDPERALRSRRSGSAPAVPRLDARASCACLHLPQDLRLADHQRIEAGGDAEQVVHRLGVARVRKGAASSSARRTPARARQVGAERAQRAPSRSTRRRRPRRGCRCDSSAASRSRRQRRQLAAAPPRPARRTTASRSRTATGAVRCDTPEHDDVDVGAVHAFTPRGGGSRLTRTSIAPPKPPSVSQAARRPRQPAPTRATSSTPNADPGRHRAAGTPGAARPLPQAGRGARPRSRRSRWRP